MEPQTTTIRIPYSDTDQMGIVHHSNYAKYCEIARWDLFRSLGVSYKSIEDMGFLLPVISMKFHFIKAVHYDELLTIETTIKEILGAKIWLSYKLYQSNGVLVNKAETELAFVNKFNWKPCLVPEFIKKKLILQ